ncbi:MutS-related protein [Clostridium tarantellae]|uniref:DNA mismatch repair protein MutS n=1 Tax=Clostridium tarantellae TaxID=39493 RepID=A0A6I1MRQ0_9CLOT|nr:DNA mismatch repair protein MutS [Clostridium tarantellae]
MRIIKEEYGEELFKECEEKYTRKLFDISEKNHYTLDNESFNDFDMDKVYKKLDRTYSSVGEGSLYKLLRNPLISEKSLKERDKLINFFQKNEKTRTKLQYLFFKLGRDRKNTFLEMIDNEILESKFKYYLYTLLGKVLPFILFILLLIFKETTIGIVLLVLSIINMAYICEKEKYKVHSHGLSYLSEMLTISKKITRLNDENLSVYTNKLKKLNKKLKVIDNSTFIIKFINLWGGIFQPLSIIFLLEVTSYYKIAPLLKKHKRDLIDLYSALGEIDALIAISSYKYSLKSQYSTPVFKNELCLNIEQGNHPLLKNGVANSVNMKKKGMILTGTNMSGKSTFLRMIGINMILAQTVYFVLAKKYEASFFNIVSSISPNDDVTNGKSYYMAEAESLLRIIKALNKDIPVFCPIDEIFRGTNPIERIAASAEILTHINRGNSISIVTTHDRELVDILKEGYEFYYFSEKVDEKEGLSFDYKIKQGISKTRNAIKLLDYIGYPKEIIEKSYKRANNIEGFI